MEYSLSRDNKSQNINVLPNSKGRHGKGQGVVQLVFGSWTWVTRNGLDFLRQDGWPLVSMTFLFNNDTGEFISRVLHRTFEKGKIRARKGLLAKCKAFFEGNYPCLGINNVGIDSEEFPFHLEFSSKCQKLVHLKKSPTYLEGLVCDQCREMQTHTDARLPIPFEVVSEIDIKPFRESQILTNDHQISSANDIFAEAEDLFERVESEDDENPTSPLDVSDNISIAPKEEPINDFEDPLGCKKSTRPRKRKAEMAFYGDSDASDNDSDMEPVVAEKRSEGTGMCVYVSSDGTKHEVPENSFDPKNYYVEWEGQTLVVEKDIDLDKIWACPICPNQAPGRQRYSHLKTHSLYRTCCGICGLPHLCPAKLWDHYQTFHEDAREWRAKCGVCQKTLNIKKSRKMLGNHLASCTVKPFQNLNPSGNIKHVPSEMMETTELSCPSNISIEYQGKLYILKGKVSRQEMWTCPLCQMKMKGHSRPRHLKVHGKFWVRCEICFSTQYCALKLWDHHKEQHQDSEIWKGKCGKCSVMIDLKQSRDALETHYLDCTKSAEEPSKTKDRSKTIIGIARKPFFLPAQFDVEWEGKNLTLEGFVGSIESWTCPICSMVMLGKQRLLHLRIHFLVRIGCEFCQLFHLCPRKLWDHHLYQHNEHEKWLVYCVTCNQNIDIKPSRDTLREHLVRCSESPLGKSASEIKQPSDKRILSAPQKRSMHKSFQMEWLGKTIVVPEKGSDSLWTCPLCENVVKERIGHLQNKHNLFQVPCGICGISHMCPYKLWDHMQETHVSSENWPIKCPICNEILDIKGSRDVCRDHLIKCVLDRRKKNRESKEVKPRPVRVCETCGKTFKKRYRLDNHIMKDHQKVKAKCPVCSIEINVTKLGNHMKFAHQATRFTCPMCFKHEKFAMTFWEHLRDNHLDRIKEFTCPVCKKDFPINPEDGPKFVTHHEECFRKKLKKTKADERKRMRSKPKKFPCPTCPKKFQTQYLLNAHLKTHKGIGKCCHLCKYRTHSAAYLRAHMHEVHGDTSDGIKCEYCQEKFLGQSSLEAHLSSNHDIKAEHQCDLCPLKLPGKLQLKKHKSRVHPDSEVTPHQDSNEFKDIDAIEDHRDESGRHLCTICEKTFNRKVDLLLHLKTVHGFNLPVKPSTSTPESEPRIQYITLVDDHSKENASTGTTSAPTLSNADISYSVEGFPNQTIVVTIDDPNSFQIAM